MYLSASSSIRKKIKLSTLFNVVYLVALCLFCYFQWNTPNNWQQFITVLIGCTIFFQFFTCRKEISYKQFGFWFIMLSYLFIFGRIIVVGLNLSSTMFGQMTYENRFRADDMYHTSLFALCAIQSVLVGLIAKNNMKNENASGLKWYDRISDYQMRMIGIFILAFSLPLRLYIDFRFIFIAQSQGSYGGISGVSGYITTLAYLAVPAVMMIMLSINKDNIARKLIFYIVVIYNLLIMVLSGDRRYQMTTIIAFFLLYQKEKEGRTKIWKIILLGFIVFFILRMLLTIRQIRYGGLSDIPGFVQKYLFFDFGIEDVFIETLSEFGITFFSLVGAIQYVPMSIPYSYGMTFLYSIPSILPLGLILGDLFKAASPARAINTLTNLNVGSSLFTDMYANFGWFSLPFLIIAGRIIRRIFKDTGLGNQKMRDVIYYSQFFILLNLVRASFVEVLRSSLWCYFIPYFIYYLFTIKKRTS